MKISACFHDIHQEILQRLQQAQQRIDVAVAWFTDKELFDALCRKAQQGVAVRVILIDDNINRGADKLNFVRLQNLKGEVTFLEPQNSNKMHHKFCIIDTAMVITGSYNWTYQARKNNENVTIIENAPEIAAEYAEIFAALTATDSPTATPHIAADVVRRRLEMIKNFILLDDIEDIAPQIRKLQPAAESYRLQEILQLLQTGKYQQAVELISDYLRRFTALVVHDDIESAELKFELKILELRLEAINNEQADLERNISLFERKQYEILGDIIAEILRIKVQYQQLKLQKMQENPQEDDDIEEAAQQAEQAEQTHREYSEEFEEIKHTEVQQLNAEQAERLKHIFRKSRGLCHPDKVPEELKEQAQAIFIELQKAYKNNEITRVEEIYQQLQAGDFSLNKTKSSTLTALEILRSTIAEMRYKIEQSLADLRALYAEPVAQLLQQIGEQETAWTDYLTQKRADLQAELDFWQRELSLLQGDDDE